MEWTSDCGSVRLICGDCEQYLQSIPEADCVITDPPYTSQTHDGALTNRATGIQKLVDFESVGDLQLREIYSLLKVRRWVISFMDYAHVVFFEKNPPENLRSVRFGVWVKDNPMPQLSGDRPAQGFEAISILHRKGGRMKWNGGGRPAVWFSPIASDGEHPTTKPLKVVHSLVSLFSEARQTILDPFMGSGTTGVACVRLGRKFIGIEREPKYFEIAKRRIREELERFPLLEKQPEPEQLSIFTE